MQYQGPCALIGSWARAWVEDHASWLRDHGPHKDGWKNTISEHNLRRLMDQLKARGHFNFYVYLAKGKDKGGDGTVRYRFRVSGLEYHHFPVLFRHEHGFHLDYPEPSLARAVFTLAEREESPEQNLRRFETLAGGAIKHPIQLRSLPCVRDLMQAWLG